jgi:hypothetical protein
MNVNMAREAVRSFYSTSHFKTKLYGIFMPLRHVDVPQELEKCQKTTCNDSIYDRVIESQIQTALAKARKIKNETN